MNRHIFTIFKHTKILSKAFCPCQPSGAIWRHTYSAAVTTPTDTACTYSGYSGPRGGVAA